MKRICAISLSLLWSCGALAQERAASVGAVTSWLELTNFQIALPNFDLNQRAMILAVRLSVGSDGGLGFRLGAGWGFGFSNNFLGLAHYESAIFWNFRLNNLRVYLAGGVGMLRFRQSGNEAWRLTGSLAAGGQIAFLFGTSIFFEIAPLTLLDFNQPHLPWVWSYRAGVLWRF